MTGRKRGERKREMGGGVDVLSPNALRDKIIVESLVKCISSLFSGILSP